VSLTWRYREVVQDDPGLARFSVQEGNALAAAQVTRLTQQIGARAIFIKGFSLEYHGLRRGHLSSDIDILVAPEDFEATSTALETAGWVERPTSFLGSRMGNHSRSYIQELWPNDIDLHFEYPGLLAGRSLVFEALWSRRVQIHYGGQMCWIPDRSSSTRAMIRTCGSVLGGVAWSRRTFPGMI